MLTKHTKVFRNNYKHKNKADTKLKSNTFPPKIFT